MLIIKLYIGAHKTATTHIQSILEANKEFLSEQKVTLSTPSTLRPKWMQIFMDYCQYNDIEKKKELLALSPENGTWLFSEENFVGNSYELSQTSSLYPNILKRLKCLVELFPKAKIELYFSIRSYETFYRSTYLEVVRNRGYLPFNEYYKKAMFQSKNWFNVIEMFRQVIPQRDITIWCYEDIKMLMPQILELLTSIEGKELIKNYPLTVTRSSLSAKTLEVLSALTKEESKAQVETIHQLYPNEKFPSFIAFDKASSALLKQQYFKDVKSIKKSFSTINFL